MQQNNKKIIMADDLKDLTHLAADKFLGITGEAISKKGVCTVALSGGSTPTGLYSLLASKDDFFLERIQWKKIHFFFGDERHVPPEHADSNFRMINECLLSKSPVPRENVHRVMTETGDAVNAAERYENLLRTFFRLEEGQCPEFDLILLGMGDDGHTASLFPGSKAIREQKRLVVSEWIEKFDSHRITLTPPVLNNAACIMFLVSGSKKAGTLKDVLTGEYKPERFPAQIVRPGNGRVLWLVDKAAGSGIGD